MKEIKFRGKTLDSHFKKMDDTYLVPEGTFVYGDLIHDPEFAPSIIPYNVGFRFSCQVDAETIGQFTGVHDKNGKEIYEGDIIRYVKCEIEFIKEGKLIDWEQRRFELAKAAMQGIISNPRYLETAYNKASNEKAEVEFIVAFNAARYADAVITKLKEDQV